MKKLFILLFFLIIAWVGISYAIQSEPGLKQKLPAVQQNSQNKQNQNNVPQAEKGTPQSIQIPSINVTATMEAVGMDEKGNMDVPDDPDNVAWYELGYKPGEIGNAVLAGHLDKESGEPAVFWNLEKLKQGDTIQITDSQGKKYTFSVVETKKYPYNDFPIKEVFGEANKSRLNLITCQGAWDSANRNYSHRVVVSAELVE